MNLKENIDNSKIPHHIAIIMDGNGRWAKQRGTQRVFGHKNGVKAVRNATEAAAELGIKYLTLYAFSTENWKRPKMEVDALMSLLIGTINSETDELIKNNVRLGTIGDISSLPPKVQKELKEAIKKTSKCSGLNLILALSYSSRSEIIRAVNKIMTDTKKGKFTKDEINETLFTKYLDTAGIPDPELMIRTSGELRISNFLLWQLAYSELYFTPVLWPDFSKDDLYAAIIDYQKRERRFGKISEQL